jgi:energy-coupling factor transport system ATP-binding protein
MSAISLRDITFTYVEAARPALSNLSLDVPQGQIIGVVGAAGAGKTTLCALCAGFVPNFYQGDFSGVAIVDGQNVVEQQVADLVRHVGLVSSDAFSQISGARFTVFEEVAFGLENLGVPRAEMIERVEWALQVTHLQDLRDRSPYALSGGQQQRLVIAATLAMRPPVLVLDEPTAQLDPHTTEQLADLLRELTHNGTTILFAEQRLEWAAELAERIAVLHEGRIVTEGAPQDVFTDTRLLDLGIGWPRPTLLALHARDAGLWPRERPLPVTTKGLLEGLSATKDERRRTDVGQIEDRDVHHLPAHPLARSPAHEAIVHVEHVRFAYPGGVEALRGVSLAIEAGERVALVGPNGAGKSTLVRHLNGLLKPSAGQVRVADLDTRTATVARCARHVGIVFQNIRNQLFARTVRDELRFGPRNLGYSAAQIESLVDHSLDALGLRDVADTHPYDLPLPMRRLVAIAAVLAMDTEVLVLDEPTAGLDTAAVARLTALIHDLAAQGKSVVVVSHDLDFCYEALQRIVLVKDGMIHLDSAWDALTSDQRALLDETVTLPIAIRAGLPRSFA